MDRVNIKSLIVIVTYNSGDFIEKCLRSIISQSYKEWFLVIIDNASGDDTVAKIREFRNMYPGITTNNFKLIVLKKNTGFAPAVNHAVFNFMALKKKELEENLEFLVLLNPDIYLNRDALKKVISTFKTEIEDKKEPVPARIGAAGGLILDYGKDTVQHFGGRIGNNFITYHTGFGKKYSELKKELKKGKNKSGAGRAGKIKESDYITGAFFAADFKLFKNMGGFDSGYRPAYFEELDYCLKLKKLGRKVVVNPDSVVRHFEGASVKKFSRNFYRFYHKNRVRCAVINLGFMDFFRKFFRAEILWLKNKATRDQFPPLLYAYFINFIFLPYNLAVKIKNHLILNKLELK
jgi:O-antigen biosynthesis protein